MRAIPHVSADDWFHREPETLSVLTTDDNVTLVLASSEGSLANGAVVVTPIHAPLPDEDDSSLGTAAEVIQLAAGKATLDHVHELLETLRHLDQHLQQSNGSEGMSATSSASGSPESRATDAASTDLVEMYCDLTRQVDWFNPGARVFLADADQQLQSAVVVARLTPTSCTVYVDATHNYVRVAVASLVVYQPAILDRPHTPCDDDGDVQTNKNASTTAVDPLYAVTERIPHASLSSVANPSALVMYDVDTWVLAEHPWTRHVERCRVRAIGADGYRLRFADGTVAKEVPVTSLAPVVVASTAPTGRFYVGDYVLACHPSYDAFGTAQITSMDSAASCTVVFDDGDAVAHVPANALRHLHDASVWSRHQRRCFPDVQPPPRFQRHDTVLARFHGSAKYFAGVVVTVGPHEMADIRFLATNTIRAVPFDQLVSTTIVSPPPFLPPVNKPRKSLLRALADGMRRPSSKNADELQLDLSCSRKTSLSAQLQ
ncbi:hypothetical protein SDRG_11456 [Saprolegnia diclina VS20]|uniref:Tudor domain-containing protein n=1 Tax=Saprolegnia diclina (strain VS20) TaxID=1156394 RepID=T0RFC3_SAPDV|nr:hypothetical protein SDRG_11456 [Saprolegnia diclina VS20]EQC30983.1 hypothetical protein SDRG_11456 [Saprolegnia diclina VS20]|eukprot:XP_008615721.1 hypothetical protein SDRG_11456 [Saprolegnia diclina VS20]